MKMVTVLLLAGLVSVALARQPSSSVVFSATQPPCPEPNAVWFDTSTSPPTTKYCSNQQTQTWTAFGGQGGGGAPTDATYLTQTANAGLSAEQALAGLATGLLKVTTGTGVVSVASAPSDYISTSDSRLSDARTPLAHVLDGHAAPTDILTLNASTTAHGLLPKLSNVATQYLNGTGAWSVPAGGGGGATKLIVTADRQNTTTSFADVTDLTLAVAATTRYVFECALISTTAVSTTATQISVNGPTQTSLRYAVQTATTATGTHYASQTAYDTVTNPATGSAAVPLPIRLRGQVLTNGSGTLAVRFRSEVAASAVNILAGSYCLVQ